MFSHVVGFHIDFTCKISAPTRRAFAWIILFNEAHSMLSRVVGLHIDLTSKISPSTGGAFVSYHTSICV